MSKKITPRNLTYLFLFLLLLVALVLFLDQRKGKKTFRTELFDADTARVNCLVIYPKADRNNPVEFVKKDDTWILKTGKKEYSADGGVVKEMLRTLNDLRSTRVAATDKLKWNMFEVDDSAATKVVVKAGRKIVSTLFIGKFSYQMPKNANPYDYYGQQPKLSTYVRIDDEPSVYSVEGFLAMVFNRSINDFRNKVVIRSERKNWKKLTFSYPADSAFVLEKNKDQWTVNGRIADSSSVDEYLSSIMWFSSEDFVDDQQPPASQPVFTLKIEGDNLVEPILIKAFEADTANRYLITSSLNKDVYFSGRKSGLTDRIFISSKKLVK